MTIGCTKAGHGAVRIDLAVVKVPFKREKEIKGVVLCRIG